jgi:hypothetical protein
LRRHRFREQLERVVAQLARNAPSRRVHHDVVEAGVAEAFDLPGHGLGTADEIVG